MLATRMITILPLVRSGVHRLRLVIIRLVVPPELELASRSVQLTIIVLVLETAAGMLVQQVRHLQPARTPLMIVWELLVVLVFMLMVAFVRLVQPVLINQQPVMPLLALNVRLVSIIH